MKRIVEVGVKKSTSAFIASKTMPGGVIDLCDSGDEDSEDGIEIVTESLGKATIV